MKLQLSITAFNKATILTANAGKVKFMRWRGRLPLLAGISMGTGISRLGKTSSASSQPCAASELQTIHPYNSIMRLRNQQLENLRSISL
jgi:hypothetical protein